MVTGHWEARAFTVTTAAQPGMLYDYSGFPAHTYQAPDARRAHPQEDHLIPLLVAVGAAEGEASACVYHQEDFFGGVTASSFRFGNPGLSGA